MIGGVLVQPANRECRRQGSLRFVLVPRRTSERHIDVIVVEAKYSDELAVQRPRAIGALHLDQDVETVRSDVAPLRRSKLGDSVIVVVVVVSVSAKATEPLQPGKETRFLGRSERHPARERR